MLRAVERARAFAGYLEDLVYMPKTLRSLASVRNGALGKILWVRSRETHPGHASERRSASLTARLRARRIRAI